MTPLERLHPDDVEAIARRVSELLAAGPPASPRLLTAAAVAKRFGVERDWVYRHADEIGAVRLGAGRRPRLRFDPDRVAAALAPRPDSKGSEAPRVAPRRAPRTQAPPSVPSRCPLLPIRGGS